MKIYCAGPMRGLPAYNWSAFKTSAKALRAKGHDVVDPTEIDEATGVVFVEYDTDGTISDVRLTSLYDYDTVIRRDLDAVAECDAIVMLAGWERSEGARLEREVAREFGLHVFYSVVEVQDAKTEQEAANWWALAETAPDPHCVDTVPDIAGRDVSPTYPILDRVDLMRHLQRNEPTALAYTPDHLMPTEPMRTNREVRIVDPETGGAKGSKLARFDLLPPDAMWAVAEQYGRGSIKYDDRNWEKSYAWSLSFAAMMRHAWQFWGGEDIDADSGSPHMAAVAWHALALLTFYLREIGTDDRAV